MARYGCSLLLLLCLASAWGAQSQLSPVVVVDDSPEDLNTTYITNVPTEDAVRATLASPVATVASFAKTKKHKKAKPSPVMPVAMNRTGPTTIVVDGEGGGDYDTVQAAIDAAPAGTAAARTTIIIKKGKYYEKVMIPATKPFLTILGEEGATIQFDAAAKQYDYSPSLAASFSVLAADTIVKGLTLINDYGWPNGRKGSQAPALWAMADRVAFYDCTFKGHQDTLFAHNGRQYYKNCAITGSVDFIFGNARALFEDCTYTAINNNDNHFSSVSAHYRQSLAEKVGFVFLRGTINAKLGWKQKNPFFGRVWGPYNTAIFAFVNVATKIEPGGWGPMKATPKSYLKSSVCVEYENSGKGAKVSRRVKWAHTDLSSEEQAVYLGPQWIDAHEWVVAP